LKGFACGYAGEEFAGFLGHSERETRPGVLSTTCSFFKALGIDQVAATLKDSTFRLADVTEGQPLDIFITIPPEKLKSHRSLLRLWVGSLITAVMRRREIPERRTLFRFDEAAHLATFDPLLTAVTFLRGFGLQVVSIWQDMAQLKSRYKEDWSTTLKNCGVLVVFGMSHFSMAREYSELLGVDPHELITLDPDEACWPFAAKALGRSGG
jgi:type IV secretion system protein VirD4